MNSLVSNFLRKSLLMNYSITRGIAVSSLNRIKHGKWEEEKIAKLFLIFFLILVEITQVKDELTIKAIIKPSGREALLVPEFEECKKNGEHFCPECTLGLEIKHTDVLILSQYIRPDGCMLPRRTTMLCKRMQKRIGTMVTMAQRAGLMPNIAPKNSKLDPTKRFGWKKFNKYYDETTIKDSTQKNRMHWSNYKNNRAYEKVQRLL